MPGRVPQPSQWCAGGDHDRCPHWVGMTVGGLWRRRPRHELVLCNDPCHSERRCPLAGGRKASREEWTARCACPGSDFFRQSFARSEERSEAERRKTAAIFADVDLSDHPDGETVERRLRDAFQAHGEQPPRGLTGMSRALAAGTGRRGTRSVRLLGLVARAAAREVRWAWQPGADEDAEDRRSLRGIERRSARWVWT